MWQVVLASLGSLVGLWAFVKYIVLIDVRLDSNTFKTLYDYQNTIGGRIFLLSDEVAHDKKYPITYVAMFLHHKSPWFYLNHSERLLSAGWQSKDSTATITCLRYQYKSLRRFLRQVFEEMQLQGLGVPVQACTPYGLDKIGTLKNGGYEPLVDTSIWQDIDEEANKIFVKGELQKSGAILYGGPGNGKTSFIKYLALKYKVPLVIMSFNPDYSNLDIMIMFGQIPRRSIILFEDFDNYFDQRRCTIGGNNQNIKFTFDVILNGLDGVYNDYDRCLFIMSANDINKIDHALKNRPSRFKFVREFGNPSAAIRQQILPEWGDSLENLNLDQILRVKEFRSQGFDLEGCLGKLGKNIDEDRIRDLAHNRYLERQANGIDGSSEDDWQYALLKANEC